MDYLALVALGSAAAMGAQLLDLGSICEKIEVLNKIWTFISYPNRIYENKQTLERKLKALCSLQDDIVKTVEDAEFRNGKKRKREVENWLNNAQRKKIDVENMLQKMGNRKYLLGPWWEPRVAKRIPEVEELCQQGNFESLLLDVRETIGNMLLTTDLVGQDSNEGVLERIRGWLVDDRVRRIGVYGVEGVGKTAFTMHIHNRLLQDGVFDNVYWVTLSDDFSIHSLQDGIVKALGLDSLDEEDAIIRAAKLHGAISRRKKCVIFLDGLSSYFDRDKVGIPSEINGCDCKLVITTRSLRLCRRMSCQETVEIKPLLVSEAENLFRDKLGNRMLCEDVEEIAKEIVKECRGLPGKIISIAESMRGVDDIHEWRDELCTFQECRGLNDQP